MGQFGISWYSDSALLRVLTLAPISSSVNWIASPGTCALCFFLSLKGSKSMSSLVSGLSGRAVAFPKKSQNTLEEIRVLAVHDRMHCLTSSKNLLEGAATTKKGAAHARPLALASSHALRASFHPKESAGMKHDFPQMSGQSERLHNPRGHFFGKESPSSLATSMFYRRQAGCCSKWIGTGPCGAHFQQRLPRQFQCTLNAARLPAICFHGSR